jgi:hypothetical protein
MDILLSFIVGFFWLKIFFLLRLTRTFGPMIKIIMAMVVEMITFICIWSLQLLFFACVGTLLFGELDAYKNFVDAFIMLLETSLGQWDLTIYDHLLLGKYIGIIFHVIVLMMNLVMLLNLIIAILANIYKVYEPKSLALYYGGIIASIPMYKYNKEFGALICGQPPFNAMIFPFVPGYFFMRCQENLIKYSQMLMHLLFAPIAFSCFVIFLVFNALLIPIAYLVSIMFKFNILFKDMQRSSLDVILEIIFFLIFGIPMLTISYFIDAFWFTRHLYLENNDKLSNYKRPQMDI